MKDIVDVEGMETTVGSANWTSFPNCDYPPVSGLPGSPTPETLEFKDPSLLRFDVAPDPETDCHPEPIANAPAVGPVAEFHRVDRSTRLRSRSNLDREGELGSVRHRISWNPFLIWSRT